MTGAAAVNMVIQASPQWMLWGHMIINLSIEIVHFGMMDLLQQRLTMILTTEISLQPLFRYI